jgi:hypothetical protein
MLVNLDKKEFVSPHKLGCGLKLWEQLANHPSTGTALIVLCAAMPEARGGGDLEEDPIIGRWAGDRIAFVGDYAEDSDLPEGDEASKIYGKCQAEMKQVYTNEPVGEDNIRDMTHSGQYYHFEEENPPEYTDISEDVARVIEHELEGNFVGSGWKHWEPITEPRNSEP